MLLQRQSDSRRSLLVPTALHLKTECVHRPTASVSTGTPSTVHRQAPGFRLLLIEFQLAEFALIHPPLSLHPGMTPIRYGLLEEQIPVRPVGKNTTRNNLHTKKGCNRWSASG